MLRRFQQITRVGSFAETRPAALQFENLCFVFGENCYGKSTLCDIFRSLAENNPDYITHRLSVPNDGNTPQRIQLSLNLPSQTQEDTFVFHQNQWNPTLPQNLKILVFDTDFIHRNVFTGLTIERRNQENISQFVLGEGSVQTAERIATLNTELRTLNRDIRNLSSNAFEGINNIPAFIELQVNTTLDQLDETIRPITTRLDTQKRLAQDLVTAINRSEPSILNIESGFEGFVTSVNQTLGLSFQQAHSEVNTRLQEHIATKTSSLPSTQTWIRQGLDSVATDSCPFCGQDFSEQASELMESYRIFFDQAFEDFVSQTNASLEEYERTINHYSYEAVQAAMTLNTSICGGYQELSEDTQFQQNIQQAQDLATTINAKITHWSEQYNEVVTSLRIKITEKREAIYSSIDLWDCNNAIQSCEELVQLFTQYNQTIETIIEAIRRFKNGLEATAVAGRIESLETQLAEHNLHRRRLTSNNACDQYTEFTLRKVATETEVNNLQQQLEQEQTNFLNTYFNSINTIFSRLGSSQFEISQQVNRRGHMPTIQLTARFSNIQISPNRLHAFFSESDRRALALSIFWAKIESLSIAERENTIVVLDDPVTSFDEGRIDRTIRLMEGHRNELRQLILLSHYPKYLKVFYDRSNPQQGNVQLLKIFRDQTGSQLGQADPMDFVESPHQRMFRHIVNFIEREHNEDISRDLRVFLEQEVKSRFYRQIQASGLGNLQFRALLDELLNLGIIAQNIRNELEQFRLSLNPEHHTWTDLSHEEKIGLANDMVEFIYETL